jgi:putative toxin-antitoxin system antitoxin component (TIGR02293 family)
MEKTVTRAKANPLLIVERMGIDEDQQVLFLQNFLGVSPRTIKRRLEGEAPSKGELLQLEMLSNINDLANQMFGNQEQAQTFLNTKLPVFGNKTAIQLLDSVEGYERVKSVLIGQAYGMF